MKGFGINQSWNKAMDKDNTLERRRQRSMWNVWESEGSLWTPDRSAHGTFIGHIHHTQSQQGEMALR